ncbi:hypothetical protein RC1_1295 [Rhodospirillum centenum SW]|uniref:Uncharacterized protein n=1 Tax=Rhodospirillum centenum (strain ATCC 51521 / SW) TaxID=414684 RepID=B6IMN5_RHOCS|nr:hypothetical protein RC1_1295 [Rhodospirillum centenum SW]
MVNPLLVARPRWIAAAMPMTAGLPDDIAGRIGIFRAVVAVVRWGGG